MNDDRDPESLYSGLMGPAVSTFGNEEQTDSVKDEILKRKEQSTALTPLAEDIKKYIDEEKMAIGDVRSYLAKTHDPEEIKDEFRAREIYLEFLTRFDTWMQNRLAKKQKQ